MRWFRRKGKWRQVRGLHKELVNRNLRYREQPCRCQWEPRCSQEDREGRMWGRGRSREIRSGLGNSGLHPVESDQRLERDGLIIPRMPTHLPIPLLPQPLTALKDGIR